MAGLPDFNSENEKKLIELVCSEEAVLLVGAGSSMMVGLPSWGELLQLLEEEVRSIDPSFVCRDNPDVENDLRYASRLRSALSEGRYQAIIHRIFDVKGFDDAHVCLLQLPFRAVLTTNYDKVLENAFFKLLNIPISEVVIDESTTNREVNKFFQSLNFGYTGDRFVTHLHGIYNRGTTIVLTLEDYEKKYGPNGNRIDWPVFKRIVWALMATRRIVYLGFSMNDPFFSSLHGVVTDEMGSFGSETHFMVTRLDIEDAENSEKQLLFAQKLLRDFGIQTVFFEDDSSYRGLREYIFKLRDLCTSFTAQSGSVGAQGVDQQEQRIEEERPDEVLSHVENEKLALLERTSRLRNQQTRDGEN